MPYFGENAIHAWAQAEQSGTPSVRDSYNISSLTDVAQGRLGFDFSVAAINNDYSFVALTGNATGTTTSGRTVNNDATPTTTYFAIRNLNMNNTNNPTDDSLINVIVVSNN